MLETKTLEIQDNKTKTVNANPYATLQDISEVQPYDAQKDAKLFKALHEVLREYDAVDRFGLTLLHDHFEVGANEWMVETHDEQNRTLTIKPYRNEELQEAKVDLQETNWRFDKAGEVVAMQLCVKDLQGAHREVI